MRRGFDAVVVGLILAFGAVAFLCPERSADFLHDDVFYADAARALIRHGFYGINGHPETNQPPGLPAILGALCLAGACTHVVFLRAMVVFETLGFVAGYALLRRLVPRTVAAAGCLLLMSSEVYFTSATRWVLPSYPYLFTTMTALLVVRRLESATTPRSRIAWAAALAALCAASIMIASAGIALLGAIVASLAALFWRDRRLAVPRLKAFAVALIVGVAVQAWWMHRPPAPLEWQIPGYPRPYLSQLRVKDGNHPELGMATWRDIPVRFADNAFNHSAWLAETLLQRPIPGHWLFPLILGPFLLIVLGWGYSIWRTGGELHDWYFAGYETIYFLWPWHLEARFVLPIAPLACLYLWRGGEAVAFLARHKTRALGAAWLSLSVILTAIAWHRRFVGTFVTWLLSALVAAWFVRGQRWSFTPSWFPRRSAQVVAAGLVIGLIVTGLTQQVPYMIGNADAGAVWNLPPPDAKAGLWVASHTDTNAVVMARHIPTVFHYSGRRVVWFPPSTDPQLLMEGVRRLKVEYVIVTHREGSYYLPSDDDCFAPLLAAYPHALRLLFQSWEFRVFQVVEPLPARTPHLPTAATPTDS